MAKQPQAEQIVTKWRTNIASKQRRIISIEETIQLKIESLRRWIWPELEPLDTWEIRQFHFTADCEREWLDDAFRPIRVGEQWGGPGTSALFRTTAAVPAQFAGKKVVLKLYFSGDGLLRIDGEPYQGVDPFRDTVLLTERAEGSERYQLEAESYIMWHSNEEEIKTFVRSEIATMDDELHSAYWDLAAACQMLLGGERIEEKVREAVLGALREATVSIDPNTEDHAAARRAGIEAAGIVRERLYDSTELRLPGTMHICGHSHLDLVYEWPYSEFLRKIGRTHSTQLRMLEQYPGAIFSQSQPLMYKEMKRLYPELFAQVKRRVAEGRWEAVGAFWVEPDCNLISGESFVRQVLHGIRFYREEFGISPKTAWIPDVFGNSWTMPQILLKSGLKYYVTHKMSTWNDTNPWDRHVFWWQGPDGSRIFAHVPPGHFIGTMDPAHIRWQWNTYSGRDTVGESLYTFGWGDGGGGPDVLMLECAKRYESFPGLPRLKMNSIEGALESMYRKAVAAGDAIPVHNDELYLEEHRGVHTTKAKLKKRNRRCEMLLKRAEMFSIFAGGEYPADRLREAWEALATTQFHDSLPGTHVTDVYPQLLDQYDTVTDAAREALDAALARIAAEIDTRGEGRAVVLFNAQPTPRRTRVNIRAHEGALHVTDPDGAPTPHQFITDFETGNTMLCFHADLPPCGYAVYRIREGTSDASRTASLKVEPRALENAHLRAVINDRGELVSLFDKTLNRECLDPERGGNVLKAFQDEPGKYDAWDIVNFYEDYPVDLGDDVEIRVVEEGPVRAAVEVRRTIMHSRFVQRIVLGADARRLDFETWIDWNETHKLLKVRFWTNVRARRATYDIAYGNIDRSTYANNSFEAARFEVPAHLWMDLSQTDWGLSLLNDCKYGHQGKESMMCLSLLRAPKHPDPRSDIEEHTFTYALYPHPQDWRAGGTYAEALDLNDAVEYVWAEDHPGQRPSRFSFLETDEPGVLVEALKQAEDGDGAILRLVERHGASGAVNLRIAGTFSSAVECNLVEDDAEAADFRDGALRAEVLPYEIRSFRLR